MLNKGLPVTTRATPMFHLLSPKENGHYCPLQIMVHPQTSVRVQPLILRSQTLHIQTILPPLILRLKEGTSYPMMGSMSSHPLSHWLRVHPTFHPTPLPLIYPKLWFLWIPVLGLLVTHLLLRIPLCFCPQCHNPTSCSHQVYHQPRPPPIS